MNQWRLEAYKFRDQLIAASLKRRLRSQYRDGHLEFRDQLIAASLKPAGAADALSK